MSRLSRAEWITGIVFAVMVACWVFAGRLDLNVTAIAFFGFGVLMFENVLTMKDIAEQGETLATFL